MRLSAFIISGMGILIEIENQVVSIWDRLEDGFQNWRNTHTALQRFEELDDLVRFCRSGRRVDKSKDVVVEALCMQAAEDHDTCLLLVWLFLPSLFSLKAKTRTRPVLDEDELESALVEGLLAAAKLVSNYCASNVCGKLKNGAWHSAQRALRRAAAHASRREEFLGEYSIVDLGEDPVLHLRDAIENGVVSSEDSGLITLTRAFGFSMHDAARALGLSESSARQRRTMAERRLAAWFG